MTGKGGLRSANTFGVVYVCEADCIAFAVMTAVAKP